MNVTNPMTEWHLNIIQLWTSISKNFVWEIQSVVCRCGARLRNWLLISVNGFYQAHRHPECHIKWNFNGKKRNEKIFHSQEVSILFFRCHLSLIVFGRTIWIELACVEIMSVCVVQHWKKQLLTIYWRPRKQLNPNASLSNNSSEDTMDAFGAFLFVIRTNFLFLFSFIAFLIRIDCVMS